MTSNSRKPTLTKAEAMDLRGLVRSDKALCVIVAAVAVLLVVAGCSRSSSDSRQLADYISGTVDYGEVNSSDFETPTRVTIESIFSLPNSEIDSRISRENEGHDKFVLKLQNSSGRTLRSVDFYASKYTLHGDPVEPNPTQNVGIWTFAEFEVIIENPPNYASLAVFHDGNKVTTIERSANTPDVSVSGPTQGEVFKAGDSVPLFPKASDADKGRLDYRIYYSTDGGDTYELHSTKYALRVPAASLESSSQSRLAVSVSDGTRSAFAETAVFAVAEHAPIETTVGPADLPPRAYDDSVNGYVGESLRIYVLRNDIYSTRDSDLDSLKIDIPPSFGVANVNDETVETMRPSDTEWVQTLRPFIEYTPTSAGTDTLTYSICNKNSECDTAQVTIKSIVNQPPVANDDVAGGDIGEVLRIDVLANDIDAEKDFNYESLVIDVPPIFGTASVKSEYEMWAQEYFIEYHYAATAIDSLTYSICDTFDQCDTAEVIIKAGTADCTILGTEDDDTLRGTSDDDVICGLGGNDTIYAGRGDDIIKAGLGDDVVFAGSGDDTIYGDAGDDTIDSGPGDDIVRGSDGNDRITGDDGADGLYGGLGDDIMDGGPGNDTIHGSKGDDTIYGGPGDDTIRGNLGKDTIYPGEGNDTLEGSTEQDTIIR